MKEDIVDRMLHWYDTYYVHEIPQSADDIQKLLSEGAEEIERVQAENDDLRRNVVALKLLVNMLKNKYAASVDKP